MNTKKASILILTSFVVVLFNSACSVNDLSAPEQTRITVRSPFSINSDTDGDGVTDNLDSFINSNLDSTVNLGDCDSAVENHLFADGSTMMDLILQCADNASNHGQFVSCVSLLTNTWKEAGLITGAQKGLIMSCAATNP